MQGAPFFIFTWATIAHIIKTGRCRGDRQRRGSIMNNATRRAAETLRTSWTLDGDRIELVADGAFYRIGTRWAWLAKSRDVWAACRAFEALEMMDLGEQNAASFGPLLMRAAAKVPAAGSAAGVIASIVRGVEAANDNQIIGVHNG
jgi:hypothetical protein